ncbi:MAG TPA: type 1 glutamine amidotransferase [Capillimicrobium sp.]|nr:type 1 glutamine amidotransferase [Capillimicrobium sp.]
MRALVLQHDHNAPAGLLAEWAAERGWSLDVIRLDQGERAPADLSAYDRVVTLGSEHAADDDSVPWQDEEQRTLRAAVAADVPVFGICFGGQSLARAMGGGVRRAALPEIGWVDVGACADGTLGAALGSGPWLGWHVDEILPPEGAEILARNASGVQAWRLGRNVGLQFHPEVDEAIVGSWIESEREVREVPDGLAEATTREAPGARARAFALFDALLLG